MRRSFPRVLSVTFIAVMTGLSVVLAPPALAAPAGFTIENLPFSGLVLPTSVEFARTGQVFVAERRGTIKVFDNLDDTSSVDVADLRERTFNNGDRGLLGMALDPNYPSRPYLWALYSRNAEVDGPVPKYNTGLSDTDDCVKGAANDCRISAELTRLTLDPAGGIWTGEEKVLLTGWCQQYGSHSIGTVIFGNDGYLYASSGDGASYNVTDIGDQGSERCADPATEGGALRSQSAGGPAADATVLNGTVLRLDPDTGLAAPGNPFAADPSAIKQRIIAYGFRNPFRMAPRPDTNEMWVADVGWTLHEELNRVDIGGPAQNFGWPCYEGVGRQAGYDGANAPACENLYAQGAGAVRAPEFSYLHSAQVGTGCATGSSAISAVAFGAGATNYPAQYRTGVFFGDYSRRCLWFAQLSGSGIVPGSAAVFESGRFPAELKSGPGGDIYLVDIAQGIRRIRYSANGNTPPIAIIKANPTSGTAPLTVQFDAGGSGDPDAGSSLAYAWDLDGDGDFDDSTALAPSRTYTAAGAVDARLRVTDNLGASTVTSVIITAGSMAPTVTVTSPATTTPWKVGDTVTFQVTATDPEDGPIPPASITTSLVIAHCPGGSNCHEHQQQAFQGNSGSFVAPDHEYPAHLALHTSATDSSGIITQSTLRLDPATVDLTIDTVPSGLKATLGSEERTTPFTAPVIQGSVNSIAVASPQQLDGTYEFASWSDGGAISHTLTADRSAIHTATFTRTGGGGPTIPGLVGSWSFNEGTGSTAADLSGRGNTGTLAGPTWTADGKYGGALSFDGVNDTVTVADSAGLDLTTAGTLTAWVRPTTLGAWRQAILKERPGGLTYALYATGQSGNRPNGTLSVGGGDRGVAAPAALADNAWSHLALSYDGAAMRLYVNGAQVATRAQTGAMATSNGPLRIGGNSVWGEYFAGQIDEARVYDRALTAAEIVTDSASAGAPDSVPPSAPGSVAAAGGVTSATVTWAASTDNVAFPTYEVHRSQVSGFSPVDATRVASGVAGTTYTDTPPAAGTYYYRVIASDGPNRSAASAQASAVITGDTAAPTVPRSVAVNVTGTSATVTWAASTDNVGVTEYQVRRTGPGGSESSLSPSPPTATTLTDSGLAAGTYGYAVRARDAAGNWSAFSAPVTGTVTVADTGIGGQVGAWSFNEGTGATAGDASGQNNPGTLQGGPVWTSAGKYGGALTFDGVNDFVSIPDANGLDLTTGMTLSAWVRPTALDNWRQVVLKERPNGLSYGLYATGATGNRPNGTIVVGGVDREVNAPAANALAADTWTHLAVSYDGSTMRIYVNGTQVATRAQTGAAATSSNALMIGGNAVWGEWFAGQIDDVRVFNRALSAAEVLTVRDTPL
jgi:glucose/arabinose dehydrogenase/PKD repeat protein